MHMTIVLHESEASGKGADAAGGSPSDGEEKESDDTVPVSCHKVLQVAWLGSQFLPYRFVHVSANDEATDEELKRSRPAVKPAPKPSAKSKAVPKPAAAKSKASPPETSPAKASPNPGPKKRARGKQQGDDKEPVDQAKLVAELMEACLLSGKITVFFHGSEL